MGVISYILLAIILLLLPIWYTYFHIKRRRLYELASKLNGPPTLPILGDILKCFLPPEKAMKAIIEGVQQYKSPSGVWLGPHFAVHVGDPKHIEVVLNTPQSLHKDPYLYGFAEAVFGNGMLCLPVEQWKHHRRMIAPAFNQKNFESFFHVFRETSNRLVSDLKHEVGKGVFDVEKYLTKGALDIVMETILDFGGTKNESDNMHLLEWLEALQKTVVRRYTNIWLYPDFVFNRTSVGKKFNQVTEEYNNYIDKLMEKWREEVSQKHVQTPQSAEVIELEKPVKLVEHMLSISDDEGQLTAEELRNEIKNIIVAGMETAASSVGNTLLALGMNPEIQQKLYDEIIEKIGPTKEIQYEDLKKLDYLERVINEGLRVFPACAIIARNSDSEIQLDKHTIPAGCTILISLVGLHRDPKIWSNPTKFDPDRFLPEEAAKRHPYSWIPFSAGPRNCIGLRFASMELKTFLVDIIRNFEVTTPYKNIDEVDLTWMLVLKPTNGYKISLKARVQNIHG